MNILVYIEPQKNNIRKAALEAVSYAAKIVENAQVGQVTALGFRLDDAAVARIEKAGAQKILNVSSDSFSPVDIRTLALFAEAAAKAEQASLLVFPFEGTGQAVAPYTAAVLHAGYIAGAVEYPGWEGNTLSVRKNVFSGKASAVYSVDSEMKVVSVLPNAVPVENRGGSAEVVAFNPDIKSANPVVLGKFRMDEDVAKGGIPLPDAERVVSGGRGLKSPENWGIIEDLAHALHAATACSRPVADADWRPHHEHVGQTGLTIRPDLYIAVGISGAIQHLAGVNGSKTIVVINNDPEAPFFKTADYGIVGDAFKVVPLLTEAIKKRKAELQPA